MLMPGGVFALLLGAWIEGARRNLRPEAGAGMSPLVSAERILAD